MFTRTRIRLILLNTAVLFVILVSIGFIVYVKLDAQMLAKLDASLMAKVKEFQVSDKPIYWSQHKVGSPSTDTPTANGNVDPRMIVVFWDEKGNPLPSTPMDTGNKDFYANFNNYKTENSPATVKIGVHYYRTYSITLKPPLTLNTAFKNPDSIMNPNADKQAENAESFQVQFVQTISNIDAEQNMLDNLSDLFVFGIVLGGAMTILAGLFLANQALQPIRRSWEKQRQFAADASHELRMPLSIIRANAELMLLHPERSALELSEPISMVLAESKRMSKLTDQLLTLARSDSDQKELLHHSVILDQLIHEVVKVFTPLAEFRNIQFNAELVPEVEILGDSEKLRQSLVILLDNSMKFTPENGKILVILRRRGHQAVIVVEDTGIGIDAKDLPHIFDRFYRGDKTRSRGDGGTGLGLAIAKWIVEKHGGTIVAASKHGKGTTMTIQMPIVHKR
jgi:two-component system sensor histidine kinase CiaH